MLYALASLFYWITLWLPLPMVVQPLVMLVDLAPRWLVFLPMCLLPFGQFTRRRLLLYTVLTIANVFFVMDFKLNWPGTPAAGAESVRVGTYNIGGGQVDYTQLLAWYRYQELDVLLLQEAREERLRAVIPAAFTFDCHSQLCVLTNHSLTPLSHLKRGVLIGYGTYAASYRLEGDAFALPIVNIHLNTPRDIMQTQKAPITNMGKFQRMFRSHSIESMLASSLLEGEREHAIIGGDFNLTQQSGRYRENWGGWQNSFDKAGVGLGRTYRMGLLAVRIDHILAGEGLRVHSSKVHPAMGGDHSPVVAVLSVR